MYISPPVNEVSDEEELNDDICEDVRNLSDIVGTYEIHASLSDTSEYLDNQSLPLCSKKTKVIKKNYK